MNYVDYEFYVGTKSGTVMDTNRFERLAKEASRIMDIYTSGIDNIKKLRVAFPADETDAETVKLCACKLIDILYQIERAEEKANEEPIVLYGDNSGVRKVVSSVSSGSETISYSVLNSATAADKVLGGEIDRRVLYQRIMREYLSGVTDANAVNLLYMGVYPYVL